MFYVDFSKQLQLETVMNLSLCCRHILQKTVMNIFKVPISVIAQGWVFFLEILYGQIIYFSVKSKVELQVKNGNQFIVN